MSVLHLSDTHAAQFSTGLNGLESLVKSFRLREANENPDVVVPMRELRLNDDGTLAIPGYDDGFLLNTWSKSQLSSLVGVKWDRWFGRMDRPGQAMEINMRLSSSEAKLRVRTAQPGEDAPAGTVRALVSPTFSPLRDSELLGLLREALEPVDPELRVVRANVTERSTTYVLGIGRAFKPGDDHEVGDCWGGLLVQNSAVGYAAARIVANFTRLVCKNVMVAPIPGAELLRKAHRAFDMDRLRDALFERLRDLPGKLANAAQALAASRERRVTDAKAAFQEVLRTARLPLRLLPELEQALEAEPALRGTAFGISQAVTRAAQAQKPEERFRLELAAGAYVEEATRTHTRPPRPVMGPGAS